MKTLVLMSGLAMRANEYLPFAASLAPRRVLHFDNPCVGEGPRTSGPLSILDQARHQWSEIERAVGKQPVHLFGLSMGGMIASTMASIEPARTLSLVVAATSPNIMPTAEAVPAELETAWLGARTKDDLALAIDIAFGKTTKLENRKVRDAYFMYRATAQNLQTNSEFAQQLGAIRSFDGASVYRKCNETKIPSLVIAGEEDELFPAAHSELIGSLLGTEVQTIKKTGHMLHVEAVDLLSEKVQRFLSRVES
ncbi:MAG: alpha/beta hydrolase [Bdellovibrionota bacterium]